MISAIHMWHLPVKIGMLLLKYCFTYLPFLLLQVVDHCAEINKSLLCHHRMPIFEEIFFYIYKYICISASMVKYVLWRFVNYFEYDFKVKSKKNVQKVLAASFAVNS